MAEEKKKPKIDLKTRIPSKTVKGLTGPSGGAIPPPPGAVPAPPPDVLGPPKPKVVADPNNPLGPATVEGGGTVESARQQIVVVSSEGEASPTSKKPVLYALIVLGLVVGLGGGFVAGSNRARGEIATKAKSDAKDLQGLISKSNEALGKFRDLLKQAINELDTKNEIDAKTIEEVKNFKIEFGPNDLKSREIAYFGEDTARKVYDYAAKIYHIDSMRGDVTRGSRLEGANTAIKNFSIPSTKFKLAVTLQKPSDDKAPPITTANLVDMGEAFELKDRVDIKTHKLKSTKPEREFDAYPAGNAKADFWEKGYASPLSSKDFAQFCPIRGSLLGNTKNQLQEIVNAIEGAGGDEGVKGAIDAGKDLGDKLKGLTKS